MKVSSDQAYRLLHEGALAFAHVEKNGMRIDTKYLEAAIVKMQRRIDHLEVRLKGSKFFKEWKRMFKDKTNLGSRSQLGHMLFGVMGFESPKETKKGRASSDAESLETIELPFVKYYLKNEKFKKAKNTYLNGIKKELEGNFVHPFFNLHTVVSIRGSANNPNSQNFPNRDPFFAEIVRRCFIPRKNHVLVEIDLKANEIRVACCYSKDETLIHDTLHGDMHRDMAARCYLLRKNQVQKNVRHVGKNCFIFPEFYGDYYAKIAPNMWDAIKKDKLQTKDGISLYKHLKNKGIAKLGLCDPEYDPEPDTFEEHIRKVERYFWDKKYSGYKKWKIDWWDEYQTCGWFEMLTGFVIRWGKSGPCDRKQAVNYPIQGSAFHCLLWVLIKMDKWLRKKKMRTKIIGQIHDSIILDTHHKELQDVLHKMKQLFVKDIRKEWEWLIIPLGVEATISDSTWWDMKDIEI